MWGLNYMSVVKTHKGNCGACPLGALARWLSWSVVSTPKGCRFDSQSGHIPRLQVQSPVGVHTGGNLLMFLSHIDVSLSHRFLSLSPTPKSINISLGEDSTKKEPIRS